ncbi:MAG: ABC transporter ATP-binding protein [Betaproteobacteria bacterium]
MIELVSVSRRFGGVRAVDELDLRIESGQVFGLIGPNGSGKSTTINLISGLFPLSAGRIAFAGQDISEMPTHKRVAAGLARTFQNIRLFSQLSVWQNLWVADRAGHESNGGFLKRWLGGPGTARADLAELLEFSGLAHKKDHLAGSLAFGEQRRLELARALATRPRMLLLDEPAAGMNAQEIGELRERILALRVRGMTILLVEHVMELVMGVTDRIAVLNFGRLIAQGTPEEIQADAAVRKAYLGGDA